MAGDAAVAIYWDFENVHACLVDDTDGDGAYRSTRFKPQEPVVDIDPVIEYAATFGRVVVHRAYANWQYFGRYRDELQAHAIDLVQMFPLAGSKNGADIRLVLDVIEDMQHHPHLTHVIVVASDSDYTSLAQRCRKHGRYFLGVGTDRTASSYQFACDEFRRYRDLAGATPATPDAASSEDREVAPLEDAGELVVKAIRRLAAGNGESWVRKAGVRPLVKRLDPTFDEAGFGYPSFAELLKALDAAGYVTERPGEHDHEVAARAELERPAQDLDEERPVASGYPTVPPQSGSTSVTLIERQLRRRGLRLPADRRILWELPDLMVRAFWSSPDQTAASFDSLRLAVEASAPELGLVVTEAEFNKVKSILLHARAFTLLGRDRGISLQVADATHLRSLIAGQLLRHLADPGDEEPSVLAEAFFGPSASGQQRDLVATVVRSGAAEPLAGPAADAAVTGAGGAKAVRSETGPAETGPTETVRTETGPGATGPAETGPGAGKEPAGAGGTARDAVTQAGQDPGAGGAAEPVPAEAGPANGTTGTVVPAPREADGQPLPVSGPDEPA
ncbi:MAG TPA: NYN domain-containing protein [Trebonia sp.]|nr:NYN domain-containing protein [Trebonia sp.]